MSNGDVIILPPVDPAWASIGQRVRRLDRLALATAERGRTRLTSGQLYAATLALHIPMRLLFEPSLDTTALRSFSTFSR